MKYALGFWLFCWCGVVMAATELYPFAATDTVHQFKQLTSELRCLVCQNQSLADSNAPLAVDLRQQIYRQLSAGQSPVAIRAYLIKRYGQFIEYQPPFQRNTVILWCGPLALFCVGIGYLLLSLSRHSRRAPDHDAAV